ncbi:DUF1003 domain-containing protein [Argonema antarcticum]|uniref:DUF1003 domain-containing protein n=1 Tax=Argonema antarcticum TaxID=2942763 RepID=UPI00201284A5|nr:DUF1003 domain-containing protein [Argonema antarcticum]MCL1473427.1 DUF1003 domain-containing protein [Argonema antarcticum A004/B2]
MKPTNLSSNAVDTEKLSLPQTQRQLKQLPPEPDDKQSTLGQRLADTLASKVGSWAFLIGQSTVLAGWVGVNLTPGLPHWDQSPFILLNLVFSFASAYTAPIVLMSQNRQSDVDRENSAYNHKVNLKTAHDLELLHEKIDEFHSKQLQEFAQMFKQQQQSRDEVKVTVTPAPKPQAVGNSKSTNSPVPSTLMPILFGATPAVNRQTQNELLNKFSDSQAFNQYQPRWDGKNLLIRPYLDESKRNAQ